ncbi:MAG: DUF1684 domain-containing protein [Xanthomonadaceae bacterium]|nr:DUF1684 domain-containing protein [Xanthomonadaceae bacterium]MDE2084694.1 DUF1684 domain-containing protein [Xanthomonadaceae bacterium]MDE2258377.1 DUF1684 domain-containing protein [Xanthomonadaceae bacterium]
MLQSVLTVAAIVAAGVGLGGSGAAAGGDAAYTKEIQSWRTQRVEHLRAPHGWLSLVALDWLKDGRNTLGSAKDNDIILAKAPAHLGTIVLDHGKAAITLDKDAGATIDGKPVREAVLLDDSHDKPTTVSFGTMSFYLIQRGDKVGLRVKDTDAPTRTHFTGIDYFPIDENWRIVAKWEAYDPPHEVEEPNILGQVDKVVVPGAAVFTRDGKSYRLEPVIETPGDTNLFLTFGDRTNGHETYGASRMLYTDPPRDGKIVIDFNKAYNPPCAFTPYATCPLPTAQNRLKLRVTAGEKTYRGTHE